MAIGKESIMRAANANNITKDSNTVSKTTQTKEKPTTSQAEKKMTAKKPKKEENKKVSKTYNEVVSNIKSDLPTYLL